MGWFAARTRKSVVVVALPRDSSRARIFAPGKVIPWCMPSFLPTRATVSTRHRASRPARTTVENLSERRPIRGI